MKRNKGLEWALSKLGLTSYEQKAYVSLLKNRPLTAKEISEKAGIPYSKVYEVLGRLEKKGWVNCDESRPSNYFPKPPSEAARVQLLKVKDELREAGEIVVKELQPIFQRVESKEKPEIWILRGKHNILAKTQEIILNSKEEILLALPYSTKEMVEPIIEALKTSEKNKVKVKLMTIKKNIKEVTNQLKTIETKYVEVIFGGGLISDNKEVILLLGRKGKEGYLAVWSKHIGLTTIAKQYFNYLWGNSSSLFE